MKQARIIVEVLAGLVPGTPMPEYTRQWFITSDEWRADQGANQGTLLAERNGQACGYAQYLMLQPDRLNWVRVDWIYL